MFASSPPTLLVPQRHDPLLMPEVLPLHRGQIHTTVDERTVTPPVETHSGMSVDLDWTHTLLLILAFEHLGELPQHVGAHGDA